MATASSSSQINLSWTDNSANETGFKIERATSASGPFSQRATVSANVKTYQNTGLKRNTTYYYRVRAYNAAGNSGYSNTATAKTIK
jgi:predicted phage tail protein